MKSILRDPKYLLHLRDEPCVITGLRASDSESVVAMHLGTAGRGIKSPDNESLPVLNSLHLYGHQHGEVSMFREKMPDWLLRACLRAYARELYAEWKEAQ